MVKLSKCPKKLVVRVKNEDEDSEWHVVTVFYSTLEKVIDVKWWLPIGCEETAVGPSKDGLYVKDVVTEAVRHSGTWREDPADTPPLQY